MFPKQAKEALLKKAAEREQKYSVIWNANQKRVKEEVANKYKQ
jgi:hypothetical protein